MIEPVFTAVGCAALFCGDAGFSGYLVVSFGHTVHSTAEEHGFSRALSDSIK